MKQTLIKITDDHYVVVDDSEIKEGDWLYSFDNSLIVQANRVSADTINSKSLNGRGYGKITHSTQPIETFNWMGNSEKGYDTIKPLSLQEIKELIGEVDVEKKATDYSKTNSKIESTGAEEFGRYWGFKEGYNQALEDNKDRKYTEEDVINAYKLGIEDSENVRLFGREEVIKDFTKELSKSVTEWEVEFDEQGKLRLV